MATATTTKALRSKISLLRQSSAFVRHLNSSPSSLSAAPPLTLGTVPDSDVSDFSTHTPSSAYSPSSSWSTDQILQLDDHRKLFGSVPASKLIHAAAVLQVSAAEAVVDLGTKVMSSRLMDVEAVRGIVYGVVRRTFYEHFCAGETPAEAREKVREVNKAGLRAMLDFAVEYTCDNDACDRNLEGFLDTVDTATSLPPSSVSFVVVKITAISPLRLLERMSDLLRWEEKDPSFQLEWKQNSFPLFSESSPLYHTLTQPNQLTPEEEQDLHLAQQRLRTLCQRCAEANLPLMVDAEDTKLQPAIDYITYSAAIEFNTKDNPVVYNTIQAYLKDAKERLLLATKAADKMGLAMGFKLVRGAYMSSERLLASKLGFESPIHDTLEDTHACFNDCAGFMIDRVASGSDGVVLATHNPESGKLAATKAREMGITRGRVEFAQLYGMSESLSMGLKNAGFQVSKYMPFGPIDIVMPYLLRRAEENRGMLSSSSFDRVLMRRELKRRLKDAVFST
ncbi:Proline dehydrogenase 2, mitochondrial [Linum perenne]